MRKRKSEYRQDIVRKYREAGQRWPASARMIVKWAYDMGLWRPRPEDVLSQGAREFSEAMREDCFADPQGRQVRRLHAFREEGEQMSLWTDITDGAPTQLLRAFQQRRRQILGGCRRLKNDADSYNENRSAVDPIQLSFDFMEDLVELEQPVKYPGIPEIVANDPPVSSRRVDAAS
ncbi:hypothetical protein JW916_01065 [Candidatus Sumerlaeota bacterium]|nr:hypothetical protein [Candidatus Sumerlaeota bacterium]